MHMVGRHMTTDDFNIQTGACLAHQFSQLVMLLAQVGVGAAPLLRGVAWELVTVDGEMGAAEQSLLGTDQQHLAEQAADPLFADAQVAVAEREPRAALVDVDP